MAIDELPAVVATVVRVDGLVPVLRVDCPHCGHEHLFFRLALGPIAAPCVGRPRVMIRDAREQGAFPGKSAGVLRRVIGMIRTAGILI